MATKEQWQKRVTAWRASGKSSEAFAEGRPFTAAGLRCMAHRVEKERAGQVRLARVEVVAAPEPRKSPLRQGRREWCPVVVRVGGVEVEVKEGFAPETLAAVVRVLEGRRR